MNEPSDSLRSRALAMLKISLEDAERMPAVEVPKLLHELQVHQMELEIQNEELRQAQIQLAHSRDLYLNLYEFAPVGYLTLDQQGVIRQANLTATTMLGSERKHLIGCKFSDLVNGDSQDTWHLHRREVFMEAETVTCELWMVPRDGASPTFRLQSLAVPDERGRLTQFRMALADDSQRRIAFDALQKLNINLDESLSDTTDQLDRSIEQLRLLSEAVAHLGEGVMITSDHLDWPGPTIIFVNEAMCQISGYKASELIGKTPRVLQGEATSTAVTQKMRRDLEAGQNCIMEVVNYRKDGTPYDVEIFITPLYESDGRRSNFVSIQRDITERKRMEEELRREHEFNSRIVNRSNSVTLVLDRAGRIVQFNPYLESITGYRFDEVQGRDWFTTFVPEAERQSTQQLFENALKGHPTHGNVNPIRTKDGDLRYIEWFDAPLTDPRGGFMGLLCTGQDVTQRRELEQHVLEVANEERRRIATDLHDSVGQELTGLSMVADSLAVALMRAKRPEVKVAEKIKQGLLRTLEQVRKLSRGMNPVDIGAEGLMSALSAMSVQLGELEGVRCSFRCDDPVLLRDNKTATQLFRIAQEATTNAIRHGRADLITISLERTDHAVVLRIVDNGCGIEPKGSRSSGMGLQTMAYRARMIQGELDVHRHDEGGTEVVCSVRAIG